MYKIIHITKESWDLKLEEIGNGSKEFEAAILDGYTEIISHNSNQSMSASNSRKISLIDTFVLAKPNTKLKGKVNNL